MKDRRWPMGWRRFAFSDNFKTIFRPSQARLRRNDAGGIMLNVKISAIFEHVFGNCDRWTGWRKRMVAKKTAQKRDEAPIEEREGGRTGRIVAAVALYGIALLLSLIHI